VYYKTPEKASSRELPQGWQTFGDIGHIDSDGYVYLTDRENDMIISGGVNLYPQEIEAVIREAPGVWDCAVVGVPDERFGERPIAYIVPIRSSITDGPILITEVQNHCKLHLGRFKRPSEIHILDSLPYSPTGKLLRRRLRELSSPE
jgi:fatty-acyl-CoA synthase